MIRNFLMFLMFILILYGSLANLEEHRAFEEQNVKLNQRIDYLQKQNTLLEAQVDFFINGEYK